jgi:CHAT domain-containing protein
LSFATQLKLLADEKQDEENALWALLDLGRSYGQMGDRFVASQFIDEALERLLRNQDRENVSWVSLNAYLLQEKALALLQYGELELAADYAVQSRRAFQKRKHPNRIADAVFIEGEIELARGNIISAQQKFENSLAYDRKNIRRPFESKCLLRIAEIKMAQKKFNEAERYNSQALALLTANDELKLAPRILIQKLEILHLRGKNQQAKVLIEEERFAIESQGRDEDKAHFAFLQASVSYAVGDYLTALSKLTNARKIIDEQLPKVRQHDLRQNYLALQKTIFELNIKSLLYSSPSQSNQALRVAENFKARTLEEKLIVLRAGENLSPEHALQRKKIVGKIQKNAVTWYSEKSRDEQQLLFDTRSLSHALEKLEAEIFNFRSSSQKVIQHDTPGLITPKTDELIVYYFTGESESWLWAISKESSEIYQLPPEEIIRHLADSVLEIFSTPPASRKNGVWEQNKSLKAISDAILTPLKDQIAASGIRHLTIVPDGPLHGFPFSALTLDGSKRPLIANYSIAYAPSLTALDNLRARAKLQQNRVSHDALVVADNIEISGFASGLPQLPHSMDEARVIQSFLGDSAIVLEARGERKQRLLQQLKEPYSILHFATHGLLNDKEPALSGLVLSDTSNADSLWLTPEISGLEINTTLVVLSACESSLGKHIPGEGLLSLSRAFIEAGASDVIGTLWSVQDYTSSVLITEFYRFLFDDGLSIAKALQKAQASVYSNNNNDWADPYYWAGYQLQGGGESLFYGIEKKT